MAETVFSDLSRDYLSLGGGGEIGAFAGGDPFWSLTAEKLNEIGESWLLTEFLFTEDWQTWEMHPHGEEIVYLLSGSMDLILEKNSVAEVVELRSKGLVIIPRYTWHTAKIIEPSKVLVITLGKETQVRAV